MPLRCLVPSPDWDAPIFKVLANNDTGNASGHQAGIVVPKDLRPYFPTLAERATVDQPTTDRRVEVELFVENTYVGKGNSRYQNQTWGGQRAAESRLTDQLGPLRNVASGGDILVIQRSIERLDLFRLTLVRKSSTEHEEVASLVGDRRWGLITVSQAPVSETDILTARAAERSQEAAPFSMFDSSAAVTSSVVRKVARSIVFRATVLEQYKTCAVCGTALRSPAGASELDAAHIVPRSLYGSDDARNGVALCKRHHWAFDRGLFSVDVNRKIIVSGSASALQENADLKKFAGKPIAEAVDPLLRAHPDAFHFHREMIFVD